MLALQRAAYAKNRSLLGVEPIPLLADYAAIMRDMEVWISPAGGRNSLAGALILEPRADDLLIWSIATDPAAQGAGLGRSLLAAAERAGAPSLATPSSGSIPGRCSAISSAGTAGTATRVERIEALSDRSITHMIKHLGPPLEP